MWTWSTKAVISSTGIFIYIYFMGQNDHFCFMPKIGQNRPRALDELWQARERLKKKIFKIVQITFLATHIKT